MKKVRASGKLYLMFLRGWCAWQRYRGRMTARAALLRAAISGDDGGIARSARSGAGQCTIPVARDATCLPAVGFAKAGANGARESGGRSPPIAYENSRVPGQRHSREIRGAGSPG